jgi:hypothetical protein
MSAMRLLAIVCVLAGCDKVFLRELAAPADADTRCLGHASPDGLARVCPAVEREDYVVPDDVDTDDVATCTEIEDAGATKICVIAASNISVRGSAVVHGNRPLLLAARHALVVEASATVDVASHGSGKLGPGASPTLCVAASGDSTTNAASGGAGGGFGNAGGAGGDADAIRGASASPIVSPTAVRAGCTGGRGGSAVNSGGLGGAGGGALYLIAGERIEIDGAIDASGAGGSGGLKATMTGGGGGGGGGGSGGLIGFDAPEVTIAAAAHVVANGGGGGGGGSNFTGTPSNGGAGRDPDVFGGTYPFAATGGNAGTPLGAAGGAGASGMAAPSTGASSGPSPNGTGGGGGGGGGAGHILIFSPAAAIADAMSFSPPPERE